MLSHSVMSSSFRPHGLAAHQAPLPTEFSRQEYWSGLPGFPPGDLRNQGIQPTSRISCIGSQVLYHQCHLGSPKSSLATFYSVIDVLPSPLFQFSRLCGVLVSVFSLSAGTSFHGVGTPTLTNVMAPMVLTGLPLWLNWKRIFLQCRRHGFDPWVGKIPGEGKGYLLQYSGLENSIDCKQQRVGHD